ncbi:condensation domain-containing protein [Streptomyces sp. L7]
MRERRHAQPQASAGALLYWKESLAGASPVLELPPDHPRPAAQSSPRRLVALRPACASWYATSPPPVGNATPPRSWSSLALFQVLLQRHIGQDDVVVGIPVANRERAELEQLIGFFVNTLPIRTDLSGDPTFAELLERTRDCPASAPTHTRRCRSRSWWKS